MTHNRLRLALALASLMVYGLAGCSAGANFTASGSTGSGSSGSGSGGSDSGGSGTSGSGSGGSGSSGSGTSGSGSGGSGSGGSGTSGSGSGGSGSSGSGSGGSGTSGSGSGGSGSEGQGTISHSSLTGNNTPACAASDPLPNQCQQAFTGQIDSRDAVETPQFDVPAGNVSTEDLHSYLLQGSNTKIYANMMLGYCTAAGSAYCDNNV